MAYVARFALSKTPRQVDSILRYVIHSASNHIRAYQRLLAASSRAVVSFRGANDLPSLPIVDKEYLFRATPPESQLHDRTKVTRCVQACTSGSTAMPVRIYMSRAEALFRKAQILLAWRSLEKLPLRLRIVDLSSWITRESGFCVVRRPWCSILRLSNALPVELRVRLLARYNPHVITSCPSDLESIAWRLAEAPIRLPALRLVALQGEILHKQTRTELEQVFACRVAEFYNCEEVGNIASQCPADASTLHINTDVCFVEVVDESGAVTPPGREGQLLLTNLYNCTMPLIRYRIGDRGVLLPAIEDEACACGSSRPRMALIGGRSDDHILLPNGRLVSPRHICDAVWKSTIDLQAHGGAPWLLRRFQVEQDEPNHLIVRVIPEGGGVGDLERAITQALRDLDPMLRCSVTVVTDIAAGPSGKLQRVIRSVGEKRAGGSVVA